MKKLLIAAAIILFSCHLRPQDIANKNIEIYLKQKFNGEDSLKLVSVQKLIRDWRQPSIDSGFVSLDSGLTAWSYINHKSKFNPEAIKTYIDSVNKVKPNLSQENVRNLKLIQSGKLGSYFTTCTFTIKDKKRKITRFYSIELDTDYNVVKAPDLTKQILE